MEHAAGTRGGPVDHDHGRRPLGLVSHTFDERETALLLPCGTALGATWDPERVRAVALAQGSEAVRRGYAAVYAPNLNLARTGLSGRTFEMYSEDPVLAGVLGAAFVTACRARGWPPAPSTWSPTTPRRSGSR